MLHKLPTELIELIGGFLEGSPRAISNLRLTCRQLAKQAYRVQLLARCRGFKMRLDYHGAHTLETISNDDQRRHMVDNVIALPRRWRSRHDVRDNWRSIAVDALRRLPNCRILEGDTVARGAHATIQVEPRIMADPGILLDLVQAPRSGRTLHDFPGGVFGPSAGTIPGPEEVHPFRALCAHLRGLDMHFNFCCGQYPLGSASALLEAPRLESLSLNGGFYEDLSLVERVAESAALPPPRTLRLSDMHEIQQETLEVLLQRLGGTLTELHLTSMILWSGKWRCLLADMVQQGGFPSLNHVVLADLREERDEGDVRFLYFDYGHLGPLWDSCNVLFYDEGCLREGLQFIARDVVPNAALAAVEKAAVALDSESARYYQGGGLVGGDWKGERRRRGRRGGRRH